MAKQGKAQGLVLIISGPSGVGKTTIARTVERASGATFIASVTTRPQSVTVSTEKPYVFVDRAEFARRRDRGEFLEWAEVFGNFYGTPREPVERGLARGETVILEIDVNGAKQVKSKIPDATGIFILPPSEATLLERLRRRGRDDEAAIQRRFAEAKAEIAEARRCGVYEHFVVNDDLAKACSEAVGLVLKRAGRDSS